MRLKEKPRYKHDTGKLAEVGIDASLGRVGDSFDNALAEPINGFYQMEVIRKRGLWKVLDDVDFDTLE